MDLGKERRIDASSALGHYRPGKARNIVSTGCLGCASANGQQHFSASPSSTQSAKAPAVVPPGGDAAAEVDLPESGASEVAVALSLGLLRLATGAFLVARWRWKHMPKSA